MRTRICLHCGEEIEPVRIPHIRPWPTPTIHEPGWRTVTYGMAHEYRCADANGPHEPEAIDV